MRRMLMRSQRPYSITIATLCTLLQSCLFLLLAAVLFVEGISAIISAVRKSKATAASLITGTVVIVGTCIIVSSLILLLLSWGLWKQKRWVLWPTVFIEGLLLLLTGLLLQTAWSSLPGGVVWSVIQIILIMAILLSLFISRKRWAMFTE